MEKLHTDILLLLAAAGVYGLDVPTLRDDLRQQRHRDLAEPALDKALRDLADRSFAVRFTSALGKQRWRATQVGRSALQEEGL